MDKQAPNSSERSGFEEERFIDVLQLNFFKNKWSHKRDLLGEKHIIWGADKEKTTFILI